MKFCLIIPFLLCALSVSAQYNVKDFGARGDGATPDTRAIQSAIDKAYEDRGGVVIIPPGIYHVSSLFLKDNIELHLENGAILLGSADLKEYTAANQKFESRTKDLYAKYFMIFAENAKNISITGQGTIFGDGVKHFTEVRPQNARPFMIRFVNCERVILRDVRLLESANWTLHLLACKDVNIDGIEIQTTGEGNRDGLDIDACERVTVSNSRFSTTDDAIVLKASTDVLCQDIAINNCIVRSVSGSALKTGTESNGGFRNITVSNCIVKDVPIHAGIELITVDGGMLQNILFDNIVMENVGTPFFIRIGKRARPYKKGQYVAMIGEVKDIRLNNISVQNAKLPSSIIGLGSNWIRNVSINNYTVRNSETQEAKPYNKIEFQEFEYPAANAFTNLPAYAFYCRNAEDIQLQNISIYAAEGEKRPALVFDGTRNVELFAVKAELKNKLASLAYIRNASNVFASQCRSLNSSNVLFEIEQKNTEHPGLSGNHLFPGQRELATTTAALKDQLFEDFKTDAKYLVEGGETKNGLQKYDLKNGPLKIELNAKKGALQLCLLTAGASSEPGKIVLKYDGIRQEFVVNWNNWGWAPVSLLKEYGENEKVTFEISEENINSHLMISRVYLRNHDTGFTD